MASKDYYRILNVSPAASSQEIKKAFRTLAHRFHPDKNEANPMAAIHFREIQEAYAVLSDKTRRTAWHYEHYYALHKTARAGLVTPEWLLRQCEQLSAGTSRQNPFLLNQDLLFLQIKEILQPYHISILQHAGDSITNSAIVQQLLTPVRALSYQQVKAIIATLREIQPVQAVAASNMERAVQDRRKQWLVDRYKIPAAILLTLALLAMIIMSLQ